MGMYTELVLGCELKRDTPKEVVDILNYMTGKTESNVISNDHMLFSTPRWRHMLRSDSFYFSGRTHSSFICDEYGKYLTVRCNLKNYNSEIELFLSWIKPYIVAYGHEFLGYSRYEECDEPDLIYYDEID